MVVEDSTCCSVLWHTHINDNECDLVEYVISIMGVNNHLDLERTLINAADASSNIDITQTSQNLSRYVKESIVLDDK